MSSQDPSSSLADLLAEFERFFDDQIPKNLQDLPYKLMDSLQNVTGEIFKQVRDFELDSSILTLPLPPFLQTAPPPAPVKLLPPPPTILFEKLATLPLRYPKSSGAAIASLAGLVVAQSLKTRRLEKRKGWRGKTVDGYMIESILILSPTVQPALLLPLVLTLLKNEYVVLLALPTLDEVEYLERKVKKLGGGLMGGLWVGVLDPFDPESFEPFHRSLHASLTTRYPSPHPFTRISFPGSTFNHTRPNPNDNYAPLPHHLPRLTGIFNLYGLCTTESSKSHSRSSGSEVPPVEELVKLPKVLTSYTNIDRSQEQSRSRPRLYTFLPSGSVWLSPLSGGMRGAMGSAQNRMYGWDLGAKGGKKGEAISGNTDVWVGEMGKILSSVDLRDFVALPTSTADDLTTAKTLGVRIVQASRGIWEGLSSLLAVRDRIGSTWENKVEFKILPMIRGKGERIGMVGIGPHSLWPVLLGSITPYRIMPWLVERFGAFLPSPPVPARITRDPPSVRASSREQSTTGFSSRDSRGTSTAEDSGTGTGMEGSMSSEGLGESWIGVSERG